MKQSVRGHTHTQTHRHMLMHTQTHTHPPTQTHTHRHTDTHRERHAHTHAHTRTHTHTDTHTHTHTQTHTRTSTPKRTHRIKSRRESSAYSFISAALLTHGHIRPSLAAFETLVPLHGSQCITPCSTVAARHRVTKSVLLSTMVNVQQGAHGVHAAMLTLKEDRVWQGDQGRCSKVPKEFSCFCLVGTPLQYDLL